MVSFRFHHAQINATVRSDGLIPDSKAYLNLLSQKHLPVPTNIYEMNQVHGNNIIHLETGKKYPPKIMACDGLITDRPDTALMIKTADCLPMIMTSQDKPVIAALHAGWKGLVAGIHREGLKKLKGLFDLSPTQIFVFIGPSIRSCCYVFPDKPAQWDDVTWQPFITQKSDGWHINLQGFVKSSLISAGVPANQISDSGQCTCHTGEYFSYFRHKKDQSPMGLFATVVQLN